MSTITLKASSPKLRYGLYAALVVLLIGVVVSQHGAFTSSVEAVKDSEPDWIAAGFAILLLSVPASANVYRNLSPKRLPFRQVLLVEAASMGINKLLPAGSGALGINYVYLRRKRLSRSMAGSVVVANNIIGFAGHGVLLVLTCLIWRNSLQDFADGNITFGRLAAGILAGCGIALVVLVLFRKKLRPAATGLLPVLVKPDRLAGALLWSIGITACYLVALLFAGAAVGLSLTPAAAMVVLSFSVLSASVIPVPGGIGAAEAGVYAGLYSMGVDTATALAAAILYRVITFWLPLAVGSVAFVVLSRRKLLA